MALYAWTDIKSDKGRIKQGSEVTSADVGGKEALDELKAVGSVRSAKFPVPDGVVDSPFNYLIREKQREIDELRSGLEGDLAELSMTSVNPDESTAPKVEESK
jgi:hypothetical protein